jgi:hypothetical protein
VPKKEPIELKLDNDLFAWIDEEDAELCQFNWIAKKAGRKDIPHYYAVRYSRVGKHRVEYYLHNEVFERMIGEALPRGGEWLVDHINGDKLDNRRSNLRLATRTENEANKLKRRTHAGKATSSRYKGVTKNNDKKRSKPWRAHITNKDDGLTYLGSFATEVEAAKAYNKAALEMFGEFAKLNTFEDEPKETANGS